MQNTLTKVRPSALFVAVAAVLIAVPLQGDHHAHAQSRAAGGGLADSLQTALQSFRSSRVPAAADTARLRRWADSVMAAAQEAQRDDPQLSRDLLQAARSAWKAAGDSLQYGTAASDVGVTHYAQGNSEEALRWFQKALATFRAIGATKETASMLNNLGVIRTNQGDFQQALQHFQEALPLKREAGSRRNVAWLLTNLGNLYEKQGRYDQALARYQEALDVNRAIDNRDGVAAGLHNVGLIHQSEGRLDEATAKYREALAINRRLGDRESVALNLNNLGIVLRKKGRYAEALSYHRRALAINREIENPRGTASSLNNAGLVHLQRGESEQALDSFERALAINRATGDRAAVALNYENAGAAYLDLGRPGLAADTLEAAVQVTETLRENATSAEARRSYLASQIDGYRLLTTAHLQAGQPAAALRSVEMARARILADHLAGAESPDPSWTVPEADDLRLSLGEGETALVYTQTRSGLAAIVVRRDTVTARWLPEDAVEPDLERMYAGRGRNRPSLGPPLSGRSPGFSSGFSAKEASEASSESAGEPTLSRPDAERRAASALAHAVRLYRNRLADAALASLGATDSLQYDLARHLHRLLVQPVSGLVEEAQTIVVVPDGPLGYLPFEALRDRSGRYLVETTSVRYTPSLTVLQQLKRRERGDRLRPLLAIGGVAYGRRPASSLLTEDGTAQRRDSTAEVPERSPQVLRRLAERRLERGESLQPTYRSIGYTQWPDLPGTEREARVLARLAGPGAQAVTGTKASEAAVHRMSEQGRLRAYRYVHFATHGMVVPEIPELSALVLAQPGASERLASQDGFLTMQEIAELDLRADVAVLSACQTAVGPYVAGEGVISLAYAVIRSGANASLVSQWRVADGPTRRFMTAVYRRARESETSFAEAVTQTKRAFLAGEYGVVNTDPSHWAAFVYVGRE